MQFLELWLTAPDNVSYDKNLDRDAMVDRAVRINDRVVGHVLEVLDVRPEAIKIRMALKAMPTLD